jgi:hypothetical protein
MSPERRKFVQTLLDRARENTLILIDETRGIISAMETGILINWSPQEFDRLKAVVAEHERLLQMHAPVKACRADKQRAVRQPTIDALVAEFAAALPPYARCGAT